MNNLCDECKNYPCDRIEKDTMFGCIKWTADWERAVPLEPVKDYKDCYSAHTEPKIKMSRWLPPLMGEGTYGTRCEMCWGSIMRNAEGVFVKTPFCPHCGKKMSNPD